MKQEEFEKLETRSEAWMLTDIFKFMWTTVKKNLTGMAFIFIFYAAAGAAVNIFFGRHVEGLEGAARTFLLFALSVSLVSVLRPAFEGGKLKIKAVFPRFGFIGKIILFFVFLTAVSLLLGLVFMVISVFGSYFLMMIFGKMLTSNTLYAIISSAIFLNLLFTAFFSFCLISFSGRHGFWESMGTAAGIFTENKLLMFCIFAFLSAAATVFLSSYISPLLSYYTGHNAAAVNKLMSLREFMLTDFSLISSALMPLYWMFLMAVYFTLGNEGGVIKELEAAPSGSGFRKEYRSEYYTGPELETGQEELPAQENVEDFTDDFSLSNAFYFSWGIYKKLFLKLTSAMIAVNALFVFICAAALFALVRFSAIPDIFAGKLPPVVNMFVILGCAFLVYYILMFFYVSFVRGFFRGKGVVLGNFFPPFKVTARFFGFVAFIAAFILSVPFIVEKADMILQLAVKSFSFPFASLVAALSLIFAVIIVYALVSLFYVPFFILDGHKFADSLTTCTQMMKGQRMAFFCVLFLLALINMAGHLTVIGFLFTVPFSVLVVMQIYITISSDYSKYKEDIVAYE